MAEGLSYCYHNHIATFLDDGLFSYDYYINYVQVHLDHIYDMSQIPVKTISCTMGSRWHRLGQAKYYEVKVLVNPSILSMGWRWAAI